MYKLQLTEHPVVRPDSGIHETTPIRDLLNLLDALALYKCRAELFVRGDDHPVLGGDAQGGAAVGDGIEGVLDLQELARPGERREGEGVSRVAHGLVLCTVVFGLPSLKGSLGYG